MKMTPDRLAIEPIGKKLRLAPPNVNGVDIRPTRPPGHQRPVEVGPVGEQEQQRVLPVERAQSGDRVLVDVHVVRAGQPLRESPEGGTGARAVGGRHLPQVRTRLGTHLPLRSTQLLGQRGELLAECLVGQDLGHFVPVSRPGGRQPDPFGEGRQHVPAPLLGAGDGRSTACSLVPHDRSLGVAATPVKGGSMQDATRRASRNGPRTPVRKVPGPAKYEIAGPNDLPGNGWNPASMSCRVPVSSGPKSFRHPCSTPASGARTTPLWAIFRLCPRRARRVVADTPWPVTGVTSTRPSGSGGLAWRRDQRPRPRHDVLRHQDRPGHVVRPARPLRRGRRHHHRHRQLLRLLGRTRPGRRAERGADRRLAARATRACASGSRSRPRSASSRLDGGGVEGLSRRDRTPRGRAQPGATGPRVIDLYWAHGEDRRTPIEETAEALGELVADGIVDRLGISNHPTWLVERARGHRPRAASRPSRRSSSRRRTSNPGRAPRSRARTTGSAGSPTRPSTTSRATTASSCGPTARWSRAASTATTGRSRRPTTTPGRRPGWRRSPRSRGERGVARSQVVLAWLLSARRRSAPSSGSARSSSSSRPSPQVGLDLDAETMARLDQPA